MKIIDTEINFRVAYFIVYSYIAINGSYCDLLDVQLITADS